MPYNAAGYASHRCRQAHGSRCLDAVYRLTGIGGCGSLKAILSYGSIRILILGLNS
jgi:hypothetical protein